MLSAFAARKAAQAVQEQQSVAIPSTPEPIVAVDSPRPPSRVGNKRKAVTAPTPRRKKKEKTKAADHGRYFASQPPEEELTSATQETLEGFDPPSDDDVDTEPTPFAPKERKWSPSVPFNDSSDEEETPSLARPKSTQPALPSICSYQPNPNQNLFQLSSEDLAAFGLPVRAAGALLVLQPAQTVTFLGTYTLAVIRGSIHFSGVTLHSSSTSYPVYAPKSSPLPVIQASEEAAPSGHLENVPERLAHLFGTTSCLIVVQEHHTGIQGLGRVCGVFNGFFEPSRWADADANNPSIPLRGLTLVKSPSKELQPLRIPPSWRSALDSVVAEPKHPIILISGPKGVGKSTLARMSLNRLLQCYQRVAYLDCDLGQSEFTPGGMVSLHVIESHVFGPPFSHPTLPNFAHYIGATTPRSAPSHYLNAIQALIQSYQLDVQTPGTFGASDNLEDPRQADSVPLIVNSMGWTKGLGADLNAKILDLVEPTHTFDFELWVSDTSTTNRSYFPTLPVQRETSSSSPTMRYAVEPVPLPSSGSAYSPADHRSLNISSYFYAQFPDVRLGPGSMTQTTASSWNVSKPLCARYPYEVQYATAIDRVFLAQTGGEDVVPSEIERVLNGSIVALVSCEPGTLDSLVQQTQVSDEASSSSLSATKGNLISSKEGKDTIQIQILYKQGAAPPSPLTSQCHGLALIRSISTIPPEMHVLTPLPVQLLPQTRVLVKGEMELPIWGMLDFDLEKNGGGDGGVGRMGVPYLQWGKGEGRGAERKRVRRNLMRKGQQ